MCKFGVGKFYAKKEITIIKTLFLFVVITFGHLQFSKTPQTTKCSELQKKKKACKKRKRKKKLNITNFIVFLVLLLHV